MKKFILFFLLISNFAFGFTIDPGVDPVARFLIASLTNEFENITTADSASVAAIIASQSYRDDATNELTGWENPENSTYSVDLTGDDVVFRIDRADSDYSFWTIGKRFTRTAASESLVIGAKASLATGTYYIYYAPTTGALTASSTAWQITNGTVQIAMVFWDGTNAIPYFEQHKCTMDNATHRYLHDTVGTRYESGLTMSVDIASASILQGETHDEDIEHTIPAQSQFRVWRRGAGGKYIISEPQTKWYLEDSDGYLARNGSDGLASVTDGWYSAVWFFSTSDKNSAIHVFPSDKQNVNLTSARATNTPESIVLTGMPTMEMKLLYRVILHRSSSSTTEVFDEVADYRNTSTLANSNYTPTDHGSLTGLDDDDHPQYATDADLASTSVASLSGTPAYAGNDGKYLGLSGGELTWGTPTSGSGGTSSNKYIFNPAELSISSGVYLATFTVYYGATTTIITSGSTTLSPAIGTHTEEAVASPNTGSAGCDVTTVNGVNAVFWKAFDETQTSTAWNVLMTPTNFLLTPQSQATYTWTTPITPYSYRIVAHQNQSPFSWQISTKTATAAATTVIHTVVNDGHVGWIDSFWSPTYDISPEYNIATTTAIANMYVWVTNATSNPYISHMIVTAGVVVATEALTVVQDQKITNGQAEFPSTGSPTSIIPFYLSTDTLRFTINGAMTNTSYQSWASSTAYASGAYLNAKNGYMYRAIDAEFGTTGSSEPVWNSYVASGIKFTDGSVTWKEVKPLTSLTTTVFGATGIVATATDYVLATPQPGASTTFVPIYLEKSIPDLATGNYSIKIVRDQMPSAHIQNYDGTFKILSVIVAEE